MDESEKMNQLGQLLDENHPINASEAQTAFEIANSLEDEDFRSWYLSMLAKKMASNKWWDRALEIARIATDFYDKADALLVIADTSLKTGESQDIPSILKETVDATNQASNDAMPWQKAEILNRSAVLHKQIRDFDNAMRLWNKAVEIAQAGSNYDTDCGSILVEIPKSWPLSANSIMPNG